MNIENIENIKTTENAEITNEVLKNKNLIYKKYLYIFGILLLVILCILYLYDKYYKKEEEQYMTESTRSDSDRKGWDLHESIKKYLNKQNSLLSRLTH